MNKCIHITDYTHLIQMCDKMAIKNQTYKYFRDHCKGEASFYKFIEWKEIAKIIVQTIYYYKTYKIYQFFIPR